MTTEQTRPVVRERLSPKEERLLAVIVEREHPTMDEVLAEVYGDSPLDRETLVRRTRAHLAHLRSKLSDGYRIVSNRGRLRLLAPGQDEDTHFTAASVGASRVLSDGVSVDVSVRVTFRTDRRPDRRELVALVSRALGEAADDMELE